jgi:hypothetical protein
VLSARPGTRGKWRLVRSGRTSIFSPMNRIDRAIAVALDVQDAPRSRHGSRSTNPFVCLVRLNIFIPMQALGLARAGHSAWRAHHCSLLGSPAIEIDPNLHDASSRAASGLCETPCHAFLTTLLTSLAPISHRGANSRAESLLPTRLVSIQIYPRGSK